MKFQFFHHNSSSERYTTGWRSDNKFFLLVTFMTYSKSVFGGRGGGSSSRDRGFSLYLDWMIIIRKNLPPFFHFSFSSSLVRLEHIVDVVI
jgi:hypothetical protein